MLSLCIVSYAIASWIDKQANTANSHREDMIS